MGSNINGPSLIRVPDWVENPLARYYLYFAHHDGDYIRLAYSDSLAGPWQIYTPGVLPLAISHFAGHIASPDVHVDHETRQIRMYYHGADTSTGAEIIQSTRVALSQDGLDFTALPNSLGEAYFRVFQWSSQHYALAMPGIFYRSPDGLQNFEQGPTLFTPDMRHCAVYCQGDTLFVFYSNAHDCPERILFTRIRLTADWHTWETTPSTLVLAPERDYEGGHLPKLPSTRGLASEPVCQLRDPAIFEEDARLYLLYSVAGEFGIAIAALENFL